MKPVKRIDEFKNDSGEITEIEIIFEDSTKVTYTIETTETGPFIERTGNL